MTQIVSAALFQKLEAHSQEFFQLSDQLVQRSGYPKEPAHLSSEIFGFHCAVLVKRVLKILFKALFRLLSIIVSITVEPLCFRFIRDGCNFNQANLTMLIMGGYGDRGYRPLGSVAAR
jgi:hypothetical protein